MRHASFLADTRDRLVVFGVRPARPETGYGYIQLGRKTGSRDGRQSYEVLRFIEKPSLSRAARLCIRPRTCGTAACSSGKQPWCSGKSRPICPHFSPSSLETARRNFSRKAIDCFYRSAEKESVDYGIMERSRRVSAVAGGFQWDDIGSWESLARITGARLTPGTTAAGDRIFEQECRDSIIVNRSPHALAVIGCSATAVIATGDAVLVMSRSKLPDLKRYLGEMKKSRKFPSRLF